MVRIRSVLRWLPVLVLCAAAIAWPLSYAIPGAVCYGRYGVGSRDGFLQFVAATAPVDGDGATWRLNRGARIMLAPVREWVPSVSSAVMWIGPLGTTPTTLNLDVTYIPYALIVAAAGVLALLAWRLLRRRPRPGCCRRCGYDLTGNRSGVCPECGTPTGTAAAVAESSAAAPTDG